MYQPPPSLLNFRHVADPVSDPTPSSFLLFFGLPIHAMDAIDIGAPTPTPLPDPPVKDFMTDAQWETLYALLDGVLPCITSTTSSDVKDKNSGILLSDTEFEALIDDCTAALSNPPSRHKIKEYLEFRPSQDENFRDDCLRSLAIVPQRNQLIKILNLLG